MLSGFFRKIKPQVVERINTDDSTASREKTKGKNTNGDSAHIPNAKWSSIQWGLHGISHHKYCRYHKGYGCPTVGVI